MDNLDPSSRAQLLAELDDIVADFSDERFALAFQRALKNVEDASDEEALAARLSYELSCMAWKILLNDLVEHGQAHATVNEDDGQLRYWSGPAA